MVGLVRGVHGLNGALKVEILTDRPEARFARGNVLFREGTDVGLTVNEAAPITDGPGWRVHFREIPDRTAADTLRGAYLEGDVPPGDHAGWLGGDLEAEVPLPAAGQALDGSRDALANHLGA